MTFLKSAVGGRSGPLVLSHSNVNTGSNRQVKRSRPLRTLKGANKCFVRMLLCLCVLCSVFVGVGGGACRREEELRGSPFAFLKTVINSSARLRCFHSVFDCFFV